MSDGTAERIAAAAQTGLALGLRTSSRRIAEIERDQYSAATLARIIADEIRDACLATVYAELRATSDLYFRAELARIDGSQG